MMVPARTCGVFPAALALAAAAACHEAPAPAIGPKAAATVVTGGGDGDQRVAELGTCTLESGERIEACRIGYRTFGKLDAARSNAVLFPTWFTGTTKSLLAGVPDKLVDTKRFFLILVDAIGDGVSSSPSNSRAQPRLRFPRFTIRDMVESQRRLVHDVLGIQRLHAVMGISMGGMQAYEWGVSRPDEVARIVPIVGTPRLTSQDMLLWNAELHALEGDVAYANGDYRGRPKIRSVQDIHWLMLTTPAHRAAETSVADLPRWLEDKESDTSFDWNDWHRQLEAMLAHDVARGGALEAAASRTKARALVVVAEHDHMVSPIPSKAFARAMGSDRAELVVLDGPCGHLSPGCDAQLLAKHVRGFLER